MFPVSYIVQNRIDLAIAHWFVGVYSPTGSILFIVETMVENRRNKKYKLFTPTKRTMLIFKPLSLYISDYYVPCFSFFGNTHVEWEHKTPVASNISRNHVTW